MNAFDKAKRLIHKQQYVKVFDNADKIVASEFVVLHCCNDVGYSRLGFALSKKNIPKAHERNRLKRLIRESFRSTKLPAIDLVFMAKKGSDKVKNKMIFSGLNAVWGKLNNYY